MALHMYVNKQQTLSFTR